MNTQNTGIKSLLIILFTANLLFIPLSSHIFSQNIRQADKNYNERIFTLRVKQLNEFIERFNYEKDFRDKNIDNVFSSRISRAEYIRLLFNEEDQRLDTAGAENYRKLIEEFILEIEDSSYLINKYSEKIFAELSCAVSYNNKKTDIRLVLNQEVNTGLKWTICGINKVFIEELDKNYPFTDSISWSVEKHDSINYIPPYSNETNFIALKNLLTENNENLTSLNSNLFNKYRHHMFYYCIYEGIIKFHHVKKITYHIFDVPGWSITVNNFVRNTENSGWLISDIRKAGMKNYQYFKNEYNIDIAD